MSNLRIGSKTFIIALLASLSTIPSASFSSSGWRIETLGALAKEFQPAWADRCHCRGCIGGDDMDIILTDQTTFVILWV